MEGDTYKPYEVGEKAVRRMIEEYDSAPDIVKKSQIFRTLEHSYSGFKDDNNLNHPLAIELLNRMIDCQRRLSESQLEQFNDPNIPVENKKIRAQVTFPRRREILVNKYGMSELDPLIKKLDDAINTKFE